MLKAQYWREMRKFLCWVRVQQELDDVMKLLDMQAESQGDKTEGQSLAWE